MMDILTKCTSETSFEPQLLFTSNVAIDLQGSDHMLDQTSKFARPSKTLRILTKLLQQPSLHTEESHRETNIKRVPLFFHGKKWGNRNLKSCVEVRSWWTFTPTPPHMLKAWYLSTGRTLPLPS
jgi:hypothetical protein